MPPEFIESVVDGGIVQVHPDGDRRSWSYGVPVSEIVLRKRLGDGEHIIRLPGSRVAVDGRFRHCRLGSSRRPPSPM